MSVEQATSIIVHDNPYVTVFPYPEKGIGILPELCCNRVILFFNKNHRVAGVPSVG
ncbi:hypothetical protein PHJA_000533700 [Phtheirospermum japonicum]|uniref:Uncharacterized protein n=1 Tax=Phtheirospermum japonicum TaxID=374723 RepID=A0A830BPI5_9LAMI|nr:hypothetical protein PHJA_000533700 [Phtheirospermum japonicum]